MRWVKAVLAQGAGAGVAVVPRVSEPVPLTPVERHWSLVEGRAETEKVEELETVRRGACRAVAGVEPEELQQGRKLLEVPAGVGKSFSPYKLSPRRLR